MVTFVMSPFALFMIAADNSGPVPGLLDSIENLLDDALDVLVKVYPALFVLSLAVAAALFVLAGSSQRMVDLAKKQLVATIISGLVVFGIFALKSLVKALLSSGFTG